MQRGTKTKSKKKIVFIILAVIVVIIIVLIVVANKAAKSIGVPVAIEKAKVGDVEQNINVNGTVISSEENVIYSPANLRMDFLNVKAGDVVHEGDVLAIFNENDIITAISENDLSIVALEAGYNEKVRYSDECASDYATYSSKANTLQAEVDKYEAFVKQSNRNINNDKADVGKDYIVEIEKYNENNLSLQQKIAESTDKDEIEKFNKEINSNNVAISQLQTAQTLMNYNHMSEAEMSLEDAREHLSDITTELAEAKAKRDAAENGQMSEYSKTELDANTDLQRLKLYEKQTKLSAVRYGIVAEKDGIVSELNVANGQMIQEGAPILKIAVMEEVKLEFSVGKNELKNLAVGQEAVVTIAGSEYTATVSHINHVATVSTTGIASILGEVILDNPDDNIYLGIDGKIEIKTASAEDTVIVPVESVNTDRNGDYVYVVNDGIANKKYVTTGVSSINDIEIIEGISEGDEVVGISTIEITDGMKVMQMPGAMNGIKDEDADTSEGTEGTDGESDTGDSSENDLESDS